MSAVAETFTAAAGMCGLLGPVSGQTDQQAEGLAVGATQGHHWTPF